MITRCRPFIVLALGIISLVALADRASAHVAATSNAGAAATAVDGRASIAITIEHGCSGNATTTVRVALPTGATGVVATNPAGWTSTVTSTEIAWTGGSLPATSTGTFGFSAILAQPAGSTITLPTIQNCTNNTEIAWIQTPSADTSEASRPAPTFVVPAGASSTTTIASGSGSATTARMATQSNAVTDEGSETSSAGRFVFLGVCAAIALGAGGLFLTYRRRSTGD